MTRLPDQPHDSVINVTRTSRGVTYSWPRNPFKTEKIGARVFLIGWLTAWLVAGPIVITKVVTEGSHPWSVALWTPLWLAGAIFVTRCIRDCFRAPDPEQIRLGKTCFRHAPGNATPIIQNEYAPSGPIVIRLRNLKPFTVRIYDDLIDEVDLDPDFEPKRLCYEPEGGALDDLPPKLRRHLVGRERIFEIGRTLSDADRRWLHAQREAWRTRSSR